MSTRQQITEPNKQASPAPGGPPDPLRRFFADLLAIQCELVGAIAAAAYIDDDSAGRLGLIARHVRDEAGPDGAATLGALLPGVERVATELVHRRQDQAAPAGSVEWLTLPARGGLYGGEPRHRVIASPLVSEGKTRGAAVVIFPSSGAARVDEGQALTLLALTNARLEAFLWREQALAQGEQKLKLRETLELLDASQQGSDAGTMGSILCHELKRRFGCSRVSIALARDDRMRVVAISGVDDLDPSSPLVEALEAAFDEGADQDVEIIYPVPEAAKDDPALQRVTRAHQRLSEAFGPASLLSLPLRVDGGIVGVCILERAKDDPFPEGAAALLRLAAQYIGPELWTRRLADRKLLQVARDRAKDLAREAVGPRHTTAKLVSAGIGLIILLAAVVPIPDRVVAEFEARASVSRTLVPPYPGYLDTVLVKPGDAVKAGQVLATMDTREVEQQIAVETATRAQVRFQRDQAQSEGKLSEARGFQAQMDGADAQLARLQDQKARSEIRAPIDGVVGRGDLERLTGAHVDPTQPLFEVIAPGRVLEIAVAERDIQRVRVGQTGEGVPKARTGDPIALRVTRVGPMAELSRGKNTFPVEAEVLGDASSLAPGASGSARLDAGRTTLLARILGPLVDEARLRLWW